MKSSILLAVLVCGSMCFGQSDAAVPVDKEPSHHRAFENEYVRVFKVEVAPHTPTLMHQHDRDYVFVTLGATEITNAVQGHSPVELALADGDTRMAKGPFAHVASNRAATPFRNVTVEIKKKSTKDICGFSGNACPTTMAVTGGSVAIGPSGGISSADVKFTKEPLFETDTVRASKITIQPGGSTPEHEDKLPRLLIAVSDLDLTSTSRLGQDAKGTLHTVMKEKAGDIVWLPVEAPHAVTNNGAQPARFIILELK